MHIERDTQSDRALLDSDQGGCAFSVYSRKGLEFGRPAKFRKVKTLPHMQPWIKLLKGITNIYKEIVMAGYNTLAGMSNNAVNAYHQGIKPLSKITVQDLKNAGVTITKVLPFGLLKIIIGSRANGTTAGEPGITELIFMILTI